MAGGYREASAVVAAHTKSAISDAERFQPKVVGATTGTRDESGRLRNRQPIRLDWRRANGCIERSFFNDYYNRVYLLPTLIDYKAVATQSRRRFNIWNAWLKPVTLERIGQDAIDGTYLTGPVAPKVYEPLELRSYEAIVEPEGPANFLAGYRFIFDTSEIPLLQLLGERARRLPFLTNWSTSYEISYEYRTDIASSRSGREQRRATRQSPRKAITYRTLASGAGVRRFNRHMTTWQNRSIIMPEETSFTKTISPSVAGNTVLRVEHVPPWLREGSPVYIRADSYEMISIIESVVGNLITLGGLIEEDIPVGADVMLALYGRLGQELQSDRETTQAFQTTIEFDVTPGSEIAIEPPAPERIVNGRPLFLIKPNWARRPTLTYIHPRETVDFNVGRTEVFNPINFSTRQTQYLFSGDASKMEAVLDHFTRMRGAAGEFYYPTWEDDLITDSPINAGTRTLDFAGSDVFDTYSGDSVYRGVMVRTRDGREMFNTLFEDITFSDGRSIMTMREEWEFDVRPEEIHSISWLLANRFAADKLTFEWITREIGQVMATFRSLEDLAV